MSDEDLDAEQPQVGARAAETHRPWETAHAVIMETTSFPDLSSKTASAWSNAHALIVN